METKPERRAAPTGINPWLIFILICIPIFIGSVDLTAIVVVLPQAALDLLGAKGLGKADQALWAVTAYLLAYTLSLTLAGRLSDVVSRKKIFVGCIAVFIVGSLWAGTATELPLQLLRALPIWPDPSLLALISLVIGRVFQAIGAGASVSVGMALVSDIFPPEERTRPISLISGLDSLGWVVGNLGGGLILQILPSWRWLFLLSAGLALPSLILVAWALRHTRSAGSGGRFDWQGGLLFGAALTGLTIGVEGLSRGTLDAYILTGGSILFFILLGWSQVRRRVGALFDVAFIKGREIRVALINNLIVGFSMMLLVAGVPLFINLRAVFLRGEGLLTGALHAGIMLCALTGPLMIAILVGERQFHQVGPALPIALGLLLSALGFLATSLWTYTAPSVLIALPLSVIGVGLGLALGPLSLIVVEAADISVRGMASSLVLMMRLLGMTIATPFAGSLTLKLANDWASDRVKDMTTYHDIARAMLIPPLTTEALTKVLLTGVLVCGIGLLFFYLPRVLRSQIKARLVLPGLALLGGIIILTGGIALSDSSGAAVAQPIAHQLPANVQSYVAINIQSVFLQDTSRPLDSVTTLFTSLANPPIPAAPSTPNPPAGGSGSGGGNSGGSAPDSLADAIKAIFRVQNWTPESYRHFCTDPIPAEPERWRDCFGNEFLGWIGPQIGIATWPVESAQSLSQYDYLFALQATNRNNAVLFMAQLAEALGVNEPVQIAPNTSLMTINAGTPDEQQLAITEAYILIGTPGAIQKTLKRGAESLADQPDFQMTMNRLSADSAFARGFLRSDHIETDLRSILVSALGSTAIDPAWRIVGRIPLLSVTKTGTDPVLIGLTLNIDQSQLAVNLAAHFPYSLQNVNVSPVPIPLINQVPDGAPLWAATSFNIADVARQIDIMDTLSTIARESHNDDLNKALANPVITGVIETLGQSLRNLLAHAQGQILFVGLPGASSDPATALPPNLALIIPMTDTSDNDTARAALATLTEQLQLVGNVSGQWSVTPEASGMLVGGLIFKNSPITAIRYALTANNALVIALSDSPTTFADLIASLQKDTANPAALQIVDKLPGQFLYVYVAPTLQSNQPTVIVGGRIENQTLLLSAILQTR